MGMRALERTLCRFLELRDHRREGMRGWKVLMERQNGCSDKAKALAVGEAACESATPQRAQALYGSMALTARSATTGQRRRPVDLGAQGESGRCWKATPSGRRAGAVPRLG